MPVTAPKIAFKIRDVKGDIVTVYRRCLGTGKPVQKQFDRMVADYKNPPKGQSERIRAPTAEEHKAWFAPASGAAEKEEKKAAVQALAVKKPKKVLVEVVKKGGDEQ